MEKIDQSKSSVITRIKHIDPQNFDPEELREAAQLIQNGEIVGFPTETVYGLGASIYSERAIAKIFQVKGRPSDNPLIVHISSMKMLQDLVLDIPPDVQRLCKVFWPGPLTILFLKSPQVPDAVTAHLPAVAIRMPSHPIAQALIDLVGAPIAAPSANTSGRPSPTSALHVFHDLNGKIPLVLDGGISKVGIESTVIDVLQPQPLILRPGGITLEQLRIHIPSIQLYDKSKSTQDLEKHPSTPGLKYTHYSPQAFVILLEGSIEEMRVSLEKMWQKYQPTGKRIGLIHTHSDIEIPPTMQNNLQLILYPLGITPSDDSIPLQTTDMMGSDGSNPIAVAHGLFHALRKLDNQGAEIVIVEGISEENQGLAVMNRLRKAASEIIRTKR
jgi:L-threonylcarbamoyladenylate synthase